jgi:hypothetical protein
VLEITTVYEPKGVVWGPKAKPKTNWTGIIVGGFALMILLTQCS